MKKGFSFLLAASLVLTACSKDDDEQEEPLEFNYDFAADEQNWEGDFADYPVDQEASYELQYGHSPLPSPLDQSQSSLKQSGNNHSDDLFMFIRHKITGLIPNRTYQATFDIQIATNAISDGMGIGGAPGEGVTIKAGMTKEKPEKEIKDGYYRMNIDKGNQATSGTDMMAIGDFANGTDENIYVTKNLSNQDPFQIQADENGEVWAIIGTDSGYEATTTIYYNKISITLK